MKIVLEEVFPYPIEKVWAAISEPEHIAGWLMKGTFSARKGLHFTFDCDDPESWTRTISGKVLEAQAPHRLQYTWAGDGDAITIVTWTLKTVDGGTLVTLVHEGFEAFGDIADVRYREHHEGWKECLLKLKSILKNNIQ
jgi:uncharacterized protein YndB with AHSA1/START domain